MTGAQPCPRCGRPVPDDAPQRLCPTCLIAAVMDDSEATGSHACGSESEADPDETADPSGVRADPPADPDVATDPVTVRYFGDYEVHEELGHGGMGVVYRARQISLNRFVALKLIRAGVLAGDDELRRFQNEVEAVAQLDHPGIVPVHEVGEHEGQRYFSMKLVAGGNLAERLAAYRDDPRAAATLLAEAAEAVHHAHVRGILHRDLKPANILVDDAGHPHLTDFGLAKRVEADFEMTVSGAILGTPAYMAPEQALGRRGSITTATDVHGLGAVFYTLLTGLAPFNGDSLVDTLTKVKEQAPERPRKLNARVPRDLEVICLNCLKKDPRGRYASAQALADDVRAWLENRPIAVRPVGAIERARLFVRRRPALAAAYILSAAVLLLAGFGGSLAWLWWTAERARAEAVVARDDEKTARRVAELASNGERTARAAAEQAREGEAQARAEAERQRAKFERSDYGRTIQVAQQHWRDNNLPAALALLESIRPELRGWEWRYIHRLCHSDWVTLSGHTSVVSWASFSPDGSRVVTAAGDAKIWDARTGAEVRTLERTNGYVSSASYSPDGSRIVAATSDRTAKVWDAKSGAAILTFKGHADLVSSASFSPDGTRVVTASSDQTAKVWDAKTGAHILTFRGHAGTVESASFSPDGTRVVTASSDRTAKVWDAKTGAEILTLKEQSTCSRSASFSPDGSRIVTTGDDKTAKVWDANSGAAILTLGGHTARVLSAVFSPDGSRIVTAGWDRTAKVWDAKTGAAILTFKGHADLVSSASFSPDGSRVVTASWDKTAKVWDTQRGAEVSLLLEHRPATTSAAFSPNGTRVLTAGLDRTAKVWDATTGGEVVTLKGNTTTGFDPQGVHSVPVGLQEIHVASFSPDGSRVVTASWDKTAKVWDTRTGAEVLSLAGHHGPIRSASFSPDGSRIVTGGQDETAKVWDATTGAEVLTFTGHARDARSDSTGPGGSTGFVKGDIQSASFSPDGSRVVTASADGTAKIWDATTGAEILTLKGHTGFVLSASYSPEGTWVVTAGEDRLAKVWDATTGGEILTLKGHTDPVVSASFSPDGSRVVTGSLDQTARVWDAETGVEVLSLKGHSGAIHSASFSPDGSRVVTGGFDGEARVWDARPFSPAKANPGKTAPEKLAASTSAQGSVRDLDGAFGFPEGQAQVVCDREDLRVSVWNNAEHLYVRAMVWWDGDDALGTTDDGRKIGDRSTLWLDLNADREPTPQVDRKYLLDPWPSLPGLHYQVVLGKGSTSLIKRDSRGRGAIRYLDAGNGRRVRVDSFALPLSEIGKRPGETIGLSYYGASEKPELAFDTPEYDLALSRRIAPFDLKQVPEGREKAATPSGPGLEKRSMDASAKTPDRPAENPTKPPSPSRATAVALLSDLRRAGKGPLADALTREIDQALADLARIRKVDPISAEHVIVGSVIGEGLDDASRVTAEWQEHAGGSSRVSKARLRIHPEGYFVGSVGLPGGRVKFLKQGYLPVEITPTGGPGSVEDVGEIRLRRVPESMWAGVKARLVVEDATGVSGARARLRMLPLGDLTEFAIPPSGEFSAPGLSPAQYVIAFSAQDSVDQYRDIRLKPGETLDLGTIRMERTKRFTVSYREAPRPPFTKAPPGRQIVVGRSPFTAGTPKAPMYDLLFEQLNGEVRFRLASGPCSIADLGPGKLDDFLRVDPASARFTTLDKVVPHPGHVYLLDQKALKHWVLFRFEFDPRTSEKGDHVPVAAAAARHAPQVSPRQSPPKLAPPQPDVLRGLDLLWRGEPLAAADAFREAIRLKPDDPTAHFNLGAALIAQKKYDASAAASREAIRLDPAYVSAYLNLGSALKAQGKNDEAAAAYREAIRLNPRGADAHLELARTLTAQGKHDEALAEYREAIKRKPGDAWTRYELSTGLHALGKFDEAAEALRTAIELEPNNAYIHYKLGTGLHTLGKFDEAAKTLRTAIELAPNNAYTHMALGNTLKNQSKLDEAIAAYRKAITLDPKLEAAYTNLGDALSKQGKADEAATAFRTADRLKPGGAVSPSTRTKP